MSVEYASPVIYARRDFLAFPPNTCHETIHISEEKLQFQHNEYLYLTERVYRINYSQINYRILPQQLRLPRTRCSTSQETPQAPSDSASVKTVRTTWDERRGSTNPKISKKLAREKGWNRKNTRTERIMEERGGWRWRWRITQIRRPRDIPSRMISACKNRPGSCTLCPSFSDQRIPLRRDIERRRSISSLEPP